MDAQQVMDPPKQRILGWKIGSSFTSTKGHRYLVFYCTKQGKVIYLGRTIPDEDVIKSKITSYCQKHGISIPPSANQVENKPSDNPRSDNQIDNAQN
jgi:hypothetical protein